MYNTEVVTEKWRVPTGQVIVSIEKFNDLYRIYTRNNGGGTDGYLYVWDGTSAAPNYVASLYGAQPVAVGSYAGFDVVIG